MVPGIVLHQHHACVAGALPQQRLQKGLDCHGIELLAQGVNELAAAQTDCAKAGRRLAGGRMKQDRILDIGRHPHAAPGTMLLEVAFVHVPEFTAPASCQGVQYFEMSRP